MRTAQTPHLSSNNETQLQYARSARWPTLCVKWTILHNAVLATVTKLRNEQSRDGHARHTYEPAPNAVQLIENNPNNRVSIQTHSGDCRPLVVHNIVVVLELPGQICFGNIVMIVGVVM